MKRNPLLITKYLIDKAKNQKPKLTGMYVSIRSTVEDWENFKATHK